MPSDREALLAGIAADPDNDLRRLVFADWLEEHGEPDRAEFIRLQIEMLQPPLPREDAQRMGERLNDLFRAHAAEWFGPFLTALDPARPVSDYEAKPFGASCSFSTPRRRTEFVSTASIGRGFVRLLGLRLASLPDRCSLGDALAREPVSHLNATLTPTPREWLRFSDPSLRHLRGLSLSGEGSGPMIAAHEAFADAHLPAVRELYLYSASIASSEDGDPIPLATVQSFANSPLAYRLTVLDLTLDDTGLRALSRSHALRPEDLAVHGTFTAEGIRPLVIGGFAPALHRLSLGDLDTAAVAALAKGTRFARLVQLSLRLREPPDAALRVLATARFLPQLEELSVSGDERLGSADRDPPGVRALADALNPDGLRRLRVAGCGYDALPPCLAKFGDRVTVE